MATKEQKKQADVRALNMLYGHAKEYSPRKKEGEDWEKHLKIFLGQQQVMRRAKKKSNTVTNFLFSQVETIVPILTGTPPSTNLKPVISNSETWDDIAEIYTSSINRIYQRQDIRRRSVELVTQGLLFRRAYFKSIFNGDIFDGHGDIQLLVPDTRSMYLEPGKSSIEDSNYIFEATMVNLLTLLRRYPDRKEEMLRLFKSAAKKQTPVDTGAAKQTGVETSMSAPGAAANTTSRPIFELVNELDLEAEDVELVEAWFHDDELMEDSLKLLNKSGTVPKRSKPAARPRFPNGRLAQFAGNMLLEDRPNKFPGFPYIQYLNYYLPGQVGMSELEQTIPLQDQYNTRSNQIFDILNRQIAGITLLGAGSQIDKDMFTNMPGLILDAVGDVNQVRQLDPPRITSGLFESLPLLKQTLETVFGVREVTQGTVPSDVRSGAAIELLQEAADVRLKGKTGELETTYRNLTRNLIRMTTKFYVDTVHWNWPEKLKKTPEFKKYIASKSLHSDFFDIEIRAGVNLPRSRVATQQFIQWTYDRGITDDEYVIEHSQLPGKEALVERMKPTWDAKREAQQQQFEQGSQPEGGGAVGNAV